MKKILGYVICSILSICFAFFGMFLYVKIAKPFEGDIKERVIVNEEGISNSIDKIYDAVVIVETKNNSTYALGSGFIYDKEGYLLTNSHVVKGTNEINITLSSGDKVNGTFVGSDEYYDIAVIKIDKKYVTTVATLGDSKSAKVGDTVFTIGTPVDTSYSWTVTKGILSAKDRKIEVSVSSKTKDWIMNLLQTDAAVNSGNSGGPLCNINGEVIGINNMKLSESKASGIGFAIPIEDAIERANMIVNGEETKKANLGVSMTDINNADYYSKGSYDKDQKTGVFIVGVNKDGPCDNAGIKPGDIVIKINDIDVKNVAELRYNLSKNKPGDTVKITVNRNTEIKNFNVTLSES